MKLDDSETIALSGSWDKTVVEWDLNKGTAIHQYTGASGQISSLEWQPMGGAIVSEMFDFERTALIVLFSCLIPVASVSVVHIIWRKLITSCSRCLM